MTLTTEQGQSFSLFPPFTHRYLCMIETQAMYMPVRPTVECPVSQLWGGMLGLSPSGS